MWQQLPFAQSTGGVRTTPQEERDVVLTVFMEGTANPIDSFVTQIGLFSRVCQAEPLSPSGAAQGAAARCGRYKLSFSGCGVTDGLRGTLFAHGLKDQCRVVREHVDTFLSAGLTLTLNFVGLSRGGIGGCYLAHHLADLDRAQVVLNMLLYDPVPGNLVWMARADVFGVMNANMAMDLSEVGNLGRVVVLYPHEPLPDFAFHAPLLITFPSAGDFRLEQDVILGCHQGALGLHPRSAANCLSFALIRSFLLECGSRLDCSQGPARLLDKPEAALLDVLDAELAQCYPTTRCCHSKVSGVEIVRREAGQFLNRSHQNLLRKLGRPCQHDRPGVPQYALDFIGPQGSC